MHAHPLFGELGVWIGLLIGAALVVVVAAAALSFFAPRIRKTAGAEAGDEHPSGPVPVVLKLLYVVFALWAAGYVAWTLLSGRAI